MTTSTTNLPGVREPELLGQTVVVIGGSAGIGLETARHARTEGADVIITGRDRERLDRAAGDVGAASAAAFDATDSAAVARFFKDLPGPINHVMITAGGPRYGPRSSPCASARTATTRPTAPTCALPTGA